MIENTLIFSEYDYDIDGLLRKAELAMADFIFMINEDDDSDRYYIDRIEGQKYDSTFNRFIIRAKNYLESDETRSLFVLIAKIEGDRIYLFDGSDTILEENIVAALNIEEDCFYGMLIRLIEGEYMFQEAIYRQESYKGDAHAEITQDMGPLTVLMQEYIKEFM